MDASRARKRARLACRACRQSKVRCQADGSSCPRCLRLGIPCTVDPAYQRTTRRSDVERLEHQVHQLQRLVKERPRVVEDSSVNAEPTLSSPVPTSSHDIATPPRDHATVAPSIERGPDQVPTVIVRTEAGGSAWRLGNEEVTKDDCLRLFTIYFDKYHHFLPILDSSLAPQEYYKKSPVLFWTVIGIAARQNREMPDLLARLKASLEDMLQTMMFNNPTYLAHIQAMILWSVWPLPNLQSWNDKTLLVISTAVPHAMQLGLHRPGFEDEYSRMGFFVRENLVENESTVQPASAQKVFRGGTWCDDPEEQEVLRRERTHTWLALITTYQGAYLEYGHLPLLSPTDRSLRQDTDRSREPSAIAPELIYYLKLSNFMQGAMKEIDELAPLHAGNADEFYMTMTKLEQQMVAIETSIVDPSWIIALRLQSSKLYLRMMYFLDDGPSERHTQAISTLYETALELISECILGHDAAYDQLAFSPLSTVRWIFCAALVLLRVSCSTLGTTVDTKAAKLAYNAAAFAIRKLAIMDGSGNDLLRIPTRLGSILRALWSRAEVDLHLCSRPPQLRVKTRLGNNLQADCLMLLRDYRMAELSGRAMPLEEASGGTRELVNPSMGVSTAEDSWSHENIPLPFDMPNLDLEDFLSSLEDL